MEKRRSGIFGHLTSSVGRRHSSAYEDVVKKRKFPKLERAKSFSTINKPVITPSPTASPQKKKKLSLTPNSRRRRGNRSQSLAEEETVEPAYTHSPPTIPETCKPVDVYSLEEVTKDDMLQREFMQFLEQKFASENFRFYLECKKYKDLACEADRKERAKDMVRDFIKNGAEYEINVEDSIKESIMSSYKKGPIELFDTAEGKVSAMMREKLTDFQMSDC